jgi:hypothetical protein
MNSIVNHCMKTNGLLLHAYDESKKASWANPTTGLAFHIRGSKAGTSRSPRARPNKLQ